MKIAVLYTCFNRKAQTLSSLKCLYSSLENYNSTAKEKICITIYLTNDGCTDGTAEAINAVYPKKDIKILDGDGNLYWAGGMRLAWNEALKRHDEWDFYLLINDDTDLFDECLEELMDTHSYCFQKNGKSGIYSGATCAKSNNKKTTYGGNVITNRFLGNTHRLSPSGTPQLVDVANANILMVSKSVVDRIGIFYDGYRHGNADYDYSMSARRHGIPVYITGRFCGACENDHSHGDELKKKILKMSSKERMKYFTNPLHSSKDYLTYIRRQFPYKYPFTWLLRMLHEKFPKIYYMLDHGQG